MIPHTNGTGDGRCRNYNKPSAVAGYDSENAATLTAIIKLLVTPLHMPYTQSDSHSSPSNYSRSFVFTVLPVDLLNFNKLSSVRSGKVKTYRIWTLKITKSYSPEILDLLSITLLRVVIHYRRFGTTYRPYHQESRTLGFLDPWSRRKPVVIHILFFIHLLHFTLRIRKWWLPWPALSSVFCAQVTLKISQHRNIGCALLMHIYDNTHFCKLRLLPDISCWVRS